MAVVPGKEPRYGTPPKLSIMCTNWLHLMATVSGGGSKMPSTYAMANSVWRWKSSSRILTRPGAVHRRRYLSTVRAQIAVYLASFSGVKPAITWALRVRCSWPSMPEHVPFPKKYLAKCGAAVRHPRISDNPRSDHRRCHLLRGSPRG